LLTVGAYIYEPSGVIAAALEYLPLSVRCKMNSFEDLFCQAHRCSPADFQRKVFWASLTWRAKMLAPLLGGSKGAHFGPDCSFIAGSGWATDLAQIRTEIRDYFEAS
jgi:hypothetical protein